MLSFRLGHKISKHSLGLLARKKKKRKSEILLLFFAHNSPQRLRVFCKPYFQQPTAVVNDERLSLGHLLSLLFSLSRTAATENQTK
jgi:hypothetical protein